MSAQNSSTPELPAREAMEFDVVVVGAGPAGLAAAIRLKQIAPEAARPGGMPGQQRVGLDVEAKTRGRPLGPETGLLFGRRNSRVWLRHDEAPLSGHATV